MRRALNYWWRWWCYYHQLFWWYWCLFYQEKCSAAGSSYWKERYSLSCQKIFQLEITELKVWIYNFYDRKMVYNLLQHSTWNHKHHPFLLCNCFKKSGLYAKVCDTHQHTMINDAEVYLLFQNKDICFCQKVMYFSISFHYDFTYLHLFWQLSKGMAWDWEYSPSKGLKGEIGRVKTQSKGFVYFNILHINYL